MKRIQGELNGAGRRFAIVASRFNETVTDRLAAGANDCLTRHGVEDSAVDLIRVPGAWELPGAVDRAASTGRYDGIVAVGCVVRGETPHFDYVAGTAASGLSRVALNTSVAVGFGLLTTDTAEQAAARAGGKYGNKGAEAALSALEMVDLYRRLEEDGART